MAHYRFNNLLGAPYRGGNLCMSGNHLLTSVGNRVMEVDLQMSSSQTLPCENLTEIRCIAVSPSGSHMISFDTDGRALLVNLRCVPHEPSPTQGAPPTTNPHRRRPPRPRPNRRVRSTAAACDDTKNESLLRTDCFVTDNYAHRGSRGERHSRRAPTQRTAAKKHIEPTRRN